MKNIFRKHISILFILTLIFSSTIHLTYAKSSPSENSINVPIVSKAKCDTKNLSEVQKTNPSSNKKFSSMQIKGSATIMVDPYEPNDDISAPAPMPSDLITANIGYNGDWDLYTQNFNAGQNIEVWLKNIPYGCDYNLYICDLYGNILAGSENYGASSEIIQATVNVTDTYMIAVLPYLGYNQNQQYTLYAGSAATSVFADSLSLSTEIDTYSATVDYSVTSSAAICLVRTGNAGIKTTIKDSSGNILNSLYVNSDDEFANTTAKTWVILNKPTGTENVYTYNFTVESIANEYDSYSDYRLTIGDSEFIETLISGIDNTVILKKYRNHDDSGGLICNYYAGNIIPNNYECYFKFIGDSRTVITLLSDYPGLRFKIIDPVTYTVLYDTNDSTSSNAHRTNYILSFTSCEKATLQTSIGKEYLLAIYTPKALRYSNSLVTGFFNLSVGEGHLMSDSGAFYSNQSITGTSSSFSPNATISVRNVPKTAMVTDAYVKSATSGVHLSDLDRWRIKRTNESIWRTSAYIYPVIKIPFTYGSSSNVPLLGDWYFSFIPTDSYLTFIPGLNFNYQYELGD